MRPGDHSSRDASCNAAGDIAAVSMFQVNAARKLSLGFSLQEVLFIVGEVERSAPPPCGCVVGPRLAHPVDFFGFVLLFLAVTGARFPMQPIKRTASAFSATTSDLSTSSVS